MIRVQNLFLERGGREVLRDVSLDLDRGEILGLVGPPESGKTVLLKSIAGLLTPNRGQVLADGGRVDDWLDADVAETGGRADSRAA